MRMLTFAEVAAQMGISVPEVRALASRGELLTVGRQGEEVVPERVLDGPVPVKHGMAVVRLLRDGGYTDEEALTWLSTEDPSLPGSPFDALHENRATEVKRRAQAAGF